MSRRALLFLLLATSAAAPSLVQGQTTTRLLGRVVNLNGEPVRDVRLRIVGHGEPQVFDSGEFELQLSGRPAQVEVVVIGGQLEVLYPLHGQLAVPGDAGVRVPIVVGKPERAYINDVLAARVLQLESTLRNNGVRYDAGVDSLSDGLKRVIQLLELKEQDLRSSIELRRRQTDVKPALFRTIDRYLLELKDLRTAFQLVVPQAATHTGARDALQAAITEYNAAYEDVNNNRNAFLSNIRNLWEGARAEGLERDLADVYTEIVEEIHKPHVLPLAGALVTIQLAHGPNPPRRQEIDAAIAAAQRAVAQLDPRINVLEVRYGRLKEALERN